MNKTYALPEDDLKEDIYRRIYLLLSRQGGGWQTAGAAFGLAGGMLSIPLALVLWAASAFAGPAGVGPTLHTLSTILFALAFPLLTSGAYLLDLLEKRPPALPLPSEPRPGGLKQSRRLRARHPHYN